MADLLPLDDALAIMARMVRPIQEKQDCALGEALYAITASPITAPYDLPPFTNTGVDGYAFRYQIGKTDFKLAGASFAGQPFTDILNDDYAVRIATGAILPTHADTVVMQENCRVEGDRLIIKTLPPHGANIRHGGADIAAGTVALCAGHRLRAQDIALLGALGFATVSVIRPLRIAIASTGQELVVLGGALLPGQIIDTNGLMLKQLLANEAAQITLLDALPDDPQATQATLRQAAQTFDLVITTGGVSVGDRDYVQNVLRDIGTVHFWRLAIRPGKPVIFGQIEQCLIMGLPGNPVSALVTFCLLVKPLLAALRGGVVAMPPGYYLPLAASLPKDVPLRSFPRAKLIQQNQQCYIVSNHDQSSNLFTSLTQSDGLLDLPVAAGNYNVGDRVLFRPFNALL